MGIKLDLNSRILLNQGISMPIMGFGTHCPPPKDQIIPAVQYALEVGYRLIDTAWNYQNEKFIGTILEKCAIPRKELFITTKIWKDAMRLDLVRDSVEESLANLKLEYLDLVLIHRPLTEFNSQTWHVLEDLKREGLVKAIGVSNFLSSHIENLRETSTMIPAVNQIEFHPFFNRKGLVDYCFKHRIQVEAYSPLTQGKKLDSPQLRSIATAHHISPAQVILRWCVQHHIVPIPKSLSKEHIIENLKIFDFELQTEEMEILDNLNENFNVIKPDPDEPTFR